MSIAEAEGRVTSYSYASLKRKSTRPSLISSLSCRGVGVLAVSFCRLRNVKLVLFSSSSIYWPFSTKMRACRRETPPSSPPWGVKSTSGKILLTASSRPIVTLSLPLRSNSWLSASTIRRATSAGAAVAAGIAGAAGASGVATGAGAAGAAVASTAAGAGVPSILAPQFEQKASPAGFCAPHDGQVCTPAAGAGLLATGLAAAVGSGVALANGSPHSSQKADPSGFS